MYFNYLKTAKKNSSLFSIPKEKIILTGNRGNKCLGSSPDVQEIVSTDIVSIRPPHGDSQFGKKKSNCPVFLIVSYPRLGKKNPRQKKSFFFQLSGRSSSRRDEVLQLSHVWIEAVTEVCLGRQMSPMNYLLPSSQPLLVLLNPASGKGQSMQIWKTGQIENFKILDHFPLQIILDLRS